MAHINASATTASPILTSSMVTVNRRTTTVHTSITANNRNASKLRHSSPIRVKLAEESDTLNGDSDSSSLYDSGNEMETDLAKSEIDTVDEASESEFEYEVADLSDSQEIESNVTSSGTDDGTHSKSFIGASVINKTDSNESEILAQDADMEESDGPIEQELQHVDYTKCVMCKSYKDSPRYRYCKKCYQFRRMHFPPRPKHRRKRSLVIRSGGNSRSASNSRSTTWMQGDGRNSSYKGNDCDSPVEKSLQQQQHQRHQTLLMHPQRHSAGESSCCSSQEFAFDDQSISTVTTTCTNRQSTITSYIDHSVDQIFVSERSHSHLFERNYPSSQEESVYPNSGTTSLNSSFITDSGVGSLAKLDSSASTVSAFTLSGLSQSSNDSNVNENVVAASTTAAVGSIVANAASKSSSLSDCNVTTTTTTTTSVADTMDNLTPSAVMLNRISSQTITSTQMLTKRQFDSTGEINDAIVDDVKRTKRAMMNDTTDSSANAMCMICLSRTKNGAFVHNRSLHVCCCYQCADKLWKKGKPCPICNLPAKTILKLFIY